MLVCLKKGKGIRIYKSTELKKSLGTLKELETDQVRQVQVEGITKNEMAEGKKFQIISRVCLKF